jgi:hypothetical protein
MKFLGVLAGFAAVAHADNKMFKSSCDDRKIKYEIPVAEKQKDILYLTAGDCNQDSTEISTTYSNGILNLEIPFEACKLKQYSDNKLFTRSSTYYSSIVSITFGKKDSTMNNLEVIFHTATLAVQCTVQNTFDVTFNYNIQDEACKNGETLIKVDGVDTCLWDQTHTGMDFHIKEYKNDWTTVIDKTDQTHIAGTNIYLGISASGVPADYTWGVDKCEIVEAVTDGSGSKTHLLIDPTNSQSEITGATCTKDSISLSGKYGTVAGNPGFRLQHLLFMLNQHDKDTSKQDTSAFSLKCSIRVCCVGTDGKACEERRDDSGAVIEGTTNQAYCSASRRECGAV